MRRLQTPHLLDLQIANLEERGLFYIDFEARGLLTLNSHIDRALL